MLTRKSLWISSAIPLIPARLTTTWILPCKLHWGPGATGTVENTAQRTFFFFLAAYGLITLESNTKLNHLKLKVNVNGLTRIHTSFFFCLFFVIFLNKVGLFFLKFSIFKLNSLSFHCGTDFIQYWGDASWLRNKRVMPYRLTGVTGLPPAPLEHSWSTAALQQGGLSLTLHPPQPTRCLCRLACPSRMDLLSCFTNVFWDKDHKPQVHRKEILFFSPSHQDFSRRREKAKGVYDSEFSTRLIRSTK